MIGLNEERKSGEDKIKGEGNGAVVDEIKMDKVRDNEYADNRTRPLERIDQLYFVSFFFGE